MSSLAIHLRLCRGLSGCLRLIRVWWKCNEGFVLCLLLSQLRALKVRRLWTVVQNGLSSCAGHASSRPQLLLKFILFFRLLPGSRYCSTAGKRLWRPGRKSRRYHLLFTSIKLWLDSISFLFLHGFLVDQRLVLPCQHYESRKHLETMTSRMPVRGHGKPICPLRGRFRQLGNRSW